MGRQELIADEGNAVSTPDILGAVFGKNGERLDEMLQLPFVGRGLTWDAIGRYAGDKGEGWDDALSLVGAIQKDEQWGYVYLIRGTHQGVERMKIGKANDLSDRLKLFAVKLPFDIETVSAFYVPQPLRTERELHVLMSSTRVSGEWFDLDAVGVRKVQLVGFAAEAKGWAACFERMVAAHAENVAMPDAEYIEYLELLLAMNQIPFRRSKAINYE